MAITLQGRGDGLGVAAAVEVTGAAATVVVVVVVAVAGLQVWPLLFLLLVFVMVEGGGSIDCGGGGGNGYGDDGCERCVSRRSLQQPPIAILNLQHTRLQHNYHTQQDQQPTPYMNRRQQRHHCVLPTTPHQSPRTTLARPRCTMQ